jgi:hypothetical protein
MLTSRPTGLYLSAVPLLCVLVIMFTVGKYSFGHWLGYSLATYLMTMVTIWVVVTACFAVPRLASSNGRLNTWNELYCITASFVVVVLTGILQSYSGTSIGSLLLIIVSIWAGIPALLYSKDDPDWVTIPALIGFGVASLAPLVLALVFAANDSRSDAETLSDPAVLVTLAICAVPIVGFIVWGLASRWGEAVFYDRGRWLLKGITWFIAVPGLILATAGVGIIILAVLLLIGGASAAASGVSQELAGDSRTRRRLQDRRGNWYVKDPLSGNWQREKGAFGTNLRDERPESVRLQHGLLGPVQARDGLLNQPQSSSSGERLYDWVPRD